MKLSRFHPHAMQVRVHTRQSLRLARVFGVVTGMILSAALFAAPAFAGFLTTLAAVCALGFLKITVDRQWRGQADFTRVSPAERRSFLVWNTTWMLVALANWGAVCFFLFTSYPLAMRAGLGHLFLLLAAFACCMFVKTGIEHAARVCSKPSDQANL